MSCQACAVVSLLLLGVLGRCEAALSIPGASRECYTQPGDVLFGMLTPARKRADDGETCLDATSSMHIEIIEAFVYAINKINSDSSILPNVSLGFVVLDTCDIYRMSLGQSLYLIPYETSSAPTDVKPCTIGNTKQHYHVAGVVGDRRSKFTLPMALSMTTAQIPIVSTFPTSDELSDPSRFSYFYSMSPPDKYQTEAILQLLASFNWTYFTLAYSEGSYGENGAKNIQKDMHKYGLCLEYVHLIYTDRAQMNIASMITWLGNGPKSRAIVMFIEEADAAVFFEDLPETLYDSFIWIGSDSMTSRTYGRPANGLISINHAFGDNPDFEAYYRSLTPRTNVQNPWFDLYWEEIYGCEWPECVDGNLSDCMTSVNVSCRQYENSTLPEDAAFHGWTVKWIDAVNTLALGLDALIRNTCPHVMFDASNIQDCISGPSYVQYIANVSFDGFTGRIDFDENGDINGRYLIKQYHGATDDNRVIGIWMKQTGMLELDQSQLSWDLYNIPGEGSSTDASLPTSVCSTPCGPRQYYIQKDVECCWECHYCRENEIITENETSCEVCDENTWPDDESATQCELIAPKYVRWEDGLGIGIIAMTTVGLLMSISSAILLFHFRQVKLIKASSRELMSIILFGISLAFLTTFAILARPHTVTCFLRDLGFSLSVGMIYAPLLVKTTRVYRIFAAGRKGNKHPALISSRAQLGMTLALIGLQILVTILTSLVKPSRPVTRMPVLIERYSELFCTLSPEALCSLLALNLLLLISCALFGFLTRQLPENFNESWFIFVSVTTTSFIWLVFLPTYFTTFYAYHKTLLLAACLLLNGFITLVCLFLPKFYAVKYVDESKMKFVSSTTATAPTENSTS